MNISILLLLNSSYVIILRSLSGCTVFYEREASKALISDVAYFKSCPLPSFFLQIGLETKEMALSHPTSHIRKVYISHI